MSLLACFLELIAYVTYFAESPEKEKLTFGLVKSDIDKLIAKSENLQKKFDLSPADYDAARFAVFAYIDEKLLISSWPDRIQWQKERLQVEYYKTSNAGFEFFERLNSLSGDQEDIKEIYCICLILGFKGRYGREKDKIAFEKLKHNYLSLFTKDLRGIESIKKELIPEAYSSAAGGSSPFNKSKKKSFLNSSLWFVAIAMPVVLYGLLFSTYYFLLNSEIALIP